DVGQVRHHLEPTVAGAFPQFCQSGEYVRVEPVLAFENVGVDQFNVVAPAERLLEQLKKSGVDLDAKHGAGLPGQPGGQATGTAADLHHQVFLRQFRGTNDQVQDIQVDEEVLPEFALGPDAALPKQVGQEGKRLSRRGFRSGHVAIVRSPSPVVRSKN